MEELEIVNSELISQLVGVDPSEFGLTKEKVTEIYSHFSKALNESIALEEDYKVSIAKPISKKSAKEAGVVRKKFSKLRTSSIKDIEASKDEFYKPYKFILQLRKSIETFYKNREEKLKEIETHFKRLEEEKLEKLREERIEKLSQLNNQETGFNVMIPSSIEKMEVDVFLSFFAGQEMQSKKYNEEYYEEQRKEKERLEKESIYQKRKEVLLPYSQFIDITELTIDTTKEQAIALKEKAERLKTEYDERQESIRIENEKLKVLQAEKDRLAKIEAEKREKAEQARLEKEQAEKERLRLEQAEKDRLAAEKAKALQDEIDRQKQAEQARIEKEQAEKDRLAKIEAERLNADKQSRIESARVEIQVILGKYNLEWSDL